MITALKTYIQLNFPFMVLSFYLKTEWLKQYYNFSCLHHIYSE